MDCLDDAGGTDPPDSIVLTGVGLCTSLGTDAETTWQAVLDGVSGIGPLTEVESPLPAGSVGGQAASLPAEYRPDLPREARSLRWTVEHALANAGIERSRRSFPAPERCCVMLGTTLHGLRAGGRFIRSGEVCELRTFLAGATASGALEGLGLEGGSATTCSACSSSLGAIALGVTLLETGQADLVVAGGYDAISEYSWAGFNALRLITPKAVRPFCVGRQGMKVAEGYGVVVLERASSARAREANVVACLTGWGESADAHHLTQPHPGGEGALAAMRAALARAGIDAREVGLITAHATGTPDNDAAEFAALAALLGHDLPAVPVVAHKSRIGHTLGGAGAIELILSALALRDQRVPGTAHVTPADIEFPLLNVTSGPPVERVIDHMLNTSLGFGGANTCVVLSRAGRAPLPASPPTLPRDRQMLRVHKACISGIGVILLGTIGLPGAIGLPQFALRASRSSSPLTGESLTDATFCDAATARRTRRMSPSVRFALAASELALRDAAILDDHARLAAATCFLGSMHGAAGFCNDYYTQIVREGVLAANPVLFAEGVPNAAAAHMTTTFRIQGACQVIIGTRTAGLDALALAALRVESGASEVVLVVATEEQCEMTDSAYTALGLRASGNGSAAGFRGFRGFHNSHGSIAFVVESEEAALARSVAPWARLGRSASAFLGPARLPRAVARALARLGTPARIIGSSNGTWLDRAEAIGMRYCRRPDVSETSATAMFGELFAATPLVGIAQSLVARTDPEGFTSLCTDWNGSVTAMNIHPLDRHTPCIGDAAPCSPT